MLYTFRVDLADMDRELYQNIDFRIAKHPSESGPYLLCRCLAYILNYHDRLEFAGEGLSDPDAPAIRAVDHNSNIELWIEIGNPSARKIHRASKASNAVLIYTYKNPEPMLKDISANNVHNVESLKIYRFKEDLLTRLESKLDKSNQWSFLRQDGRIDIGIKDEVVSFDLEVVKLKTN